MSFIKTFKPPTEFDIEDMYPDVSFEYINDEIEQIDIDDFSSKYVILDKSYRFVSMNECGYRDVLMLCKRTGKLYCLTIAERDADDIYVGLYIVASNPEKHPKLKKILRESNINRRNIIRRALKWNKVRK